MTATIFGSIVAAILVSTIIYLMRGEITNALSSNIQTNNQGTQTSIPASITSCATTLADTEGYSPPAAETTSAPAPQPVVAMPSVVKHSFNTVNNTTNNVTNVASK
jgi:hypothetical protein